MNVLEHERSKYEQVWQIPDYAAHSPGEKYADLFVEIAKPPVGASVIDLGCGAGAGGAALRASAKGLEVAYLDFVRVGNLEPFIEQPLWKPFRRINGGHVQPWDYGYCCDVMEHIPQEYSMLCIRNMLDACQAVFFSISFTPDYFGRFVGEPLHVNVKPFTWWVDRLGQMGDLKEARDLLGEGVFYVSA